MTPNQTFSGARFASYFRLYTGENARQLAIYAASVPIIMTVLMILPMVLTWFSVYNQDYSYREFLDASTKYDPQWTWAVSVAGICFGIFVVLTGNVFYQSMFGKNRRLATLAVPASQFEKWLTYAIVYGLGFIVVYVFSFFLSDAVRVLLGKCFAKHSEMVMMLHVGSYLDTLFSLTENGGWWITLMVLGSAWFYYCIFALGSILWSKTHFFKTILAMLAVQVVVSTLVSAVMMLYFAHAHNVDMRFDLDPSMTGLVVVAYALVFAVCSFITWLAYCRFKDSEIVNRW